MRMASKKWFGLAVQTVSVVLSLILLNMFFVKKYELPYYMESRNGGFAHSQHLPELICPYSSSSYGIYLVETKFDDGVSLRGACIVEAAAIKHPARQIFVMHTKKIVTLNEQTAALLVKHLNVRLVNVDYNDLFRGTPLQRWHEENRIGDSLHPIEHLSDAIRLAVIYRCGGIYLDTDALAVRSLSGLHNAIGYSSSELNGGELNNAILIFDKFHPYLNDCMAFFADHYRPENYTGNGPQLVSHVMRRYCGRFDLVNAVDRPHTCRDVTVMAEAAFYPFPWPAWKLLFGSKSANKYDMNGAFVMHLVGSQSANVNAKPGTGTWLEELSREHCPTTYRTMVKLGRV